MNREYKNREYKFELNIEGIEKIYNSMDKGIDIRFLSKFLYYFKSISSLLLYPDTYPSIIEVEEEITKKNGIEFHIEITKKGEIGFYINDIQKYLSIPSIYLNRNKYRFFIEKEPSINISSITRGSLELEFISPTYITVIILGITFALKILKSENISLKGKLSIKNKINVSIDINLSDPKPRNDNEFKGPSM